MSSTGLLSIPISICSVWDIETGTDICTFDNHKDGEKITALDYINPHDLTYLMTGTGNEYSGHNKLSTSTQLIYLSQVSVCYLFTVFVCALEWSICKVLYVCVRLSSFCCSLQTRGLCGCGGTG